MRTTTAGRGVAFAALSVPIAWGMLVAVATMALVATAKADEAECMGYFGTAYRAYMTSKKRFVPFVF